jgi:branched-chain amino acid transport system substrate-binding protein
MTRLDMGITRRTVLAGMATAAVMSRSASATDKPLKVGFSVPKTGWGAGGAAASTLPPYYLWFKDVNERGGIQVGAAKRQIELVEYDDRSLIEDAVRNTERLINQDKCDFILAPWGTAFNLAVAPLLNKANYPHLAVAAVTDQADLLVKRWPNAFFLIGPSAKGGEALVGVLQSLAKSNALGKTVALCGVQDQFGIELFKAMRAALTAAGYSVAMTRQYPLGSQDLSSIITEAKAANPDIFIGCSYPPDTLALADAAKVQSFNPKIFYLGVGTAYTLFREKFGASAEGVMGAGGLDTRNPKIKNYIEHHTAVTKSAPDYWANPVTYASLEMLEQAITRVGGVDRAAVIKDLQTGTFDTVIGKISLKNNQRPTQWWVGQWQDGEFVAVGPEGLDGVRPSKFPKPGWS